jgi:hypothetical protein
MTTEAELATRLVLRLALLNTEIGPSPDLDLDGWRAWRERRAELTAQMVAELRANGWTITEKWNGSRVRPALPGARAASCTSGVVGALHNWIAAARKRQVLEAAQ